MSFQAYLNNIHAKTGKTPADFRALAKKKGLTTYREVLDWLKADFGLGHGHANAIAQLLINADKFKAAPADKLAAHFAGDKLKWRQAYEVLADKLQQFGPDVTLAPNQTYINVLRKRKKFAILQPSTAERFDIGIKLKGVAPTDRFEQAGNWNSMVTHRVRISDPKQINAEVIKWLKQAYEAA